MSDVATQAQAARDAVEEVFQRKCDEIEGRAERLRRIWTPSKETSEGSTQEAITEATDYIEGLGVAVA